MVVPGVARGDSGSGPSRLPGPKGIPYFGCLNGLLRNPMAFWSRIANRYGGIAEVPLKGRRVVLISDPELIYDLLITKRNHYRKNVRYKAAVDTFGEGLLLAEGATWKRQRLITQPAFKANYIGSQIPMIAELTTRFLDRWDPVAKDGAVRNVETDFFRLAQTIAGHYLMGPGFEAIDERFFSLAVEIKDSWPLPPRSVLALLAPKSKTREARLDAAVREVGELIFGYLAHHRKSNFENCGVVEMLVHSSRAQGDEFDDKALRDQLLTLFFAGHETTAVSLTWIHYLLAENPAVRSRMFAEITNRLGDRQDLSPDDIDKLEYTEQAVNEALRLYSPIHSLSRVALEDTQIGDHSIPAGTMIYVSLYAVHRLPSIWPDPDRFDPDRFTAEAGAMRPRFAFIPYAAGHRNCIGATLATTELKLVLAQIARRFVLDLAPGQRVEPAAGTTMHPKYGMRMRISPRQDPNTAEGQEQCPVVSRQAISD